MRPPRDAMLKVRTGKIRKRLGVHVRRDQIARRRRQAAPAHRVLQPRDAEAGAGGKGRKVLQGAAEAREDEAVDAGAEEAGGLGGEVGAVAVAYEDDFGGLEGLAGVGD